MSEIRFPIRPRREDETGWLAVQTNLEAVAGMFSRGTVSGQTLVWNDTTGRWDVGPAGLGTLTTSLPGSPTDGQVVLLTDSLTAPTYQWPLRYLAAASKWYPTYGPGWGRGTSMPSVPAGVDQVVFEYASSASRWQFRYNASSGSSYKWELVGGAPAYSGWASGSYTTSVWTSFSPAATWTVPLSGEYEVAYFGSMESATDHQAIYASLFLNGSEFLTAVADSFNSPSTKRYHMGRKHGYWTFAASDTLEFKNYTASTFAIYYDFQASFLPWRVA